MRILALHGHPLDRRMWTPLAEAAERGELGPDVRILAPDLRGRGSSARPAVASHDMSLLADDVMEELERETAPDEPILAMGLSMGGYVLFELLRRHGRRLSGRLKGLVLCDTRADADDEAGKKRRMDAAADIERRGMVASIEGMLPKLLSPGCKGTPLEELVADMIRKTPPETAAADQRGMAAREDAYDVLAACELPTLLVFGEEDVITPPPHGEDLAAGLGKSPYVRLFTVPGAGHMAPLEKPSEVAGAIAELIRRVRTPG